MKNKIIFTGGGTGGHLYPIISIVRKLKELYPSDLPPLEMYFLGPLNSCSDLLKKEGIIIIPISTGKLRRYITLQSIINNLIDIFWNIPKGVIQSIKILKEIKPNLIFSKGGYGSIPVILAARYLKIPLFIHESDKVASLSTKIALPLANIIFTSFPETKGIPLGKKIIISGNPIREDLLNGDKEEGHKMFKISGKRPVLLILGGSQGAQRINNVIINALSKLLDMFEIIHQCGTKNEKIIRDNLSILIKPGQEKYYHLFGSLNEKQLSNAYKVADLVISRAGAGAIFEISLNGKPSILVPLPESAQNHQRENAYFYAKTGGAIVIEENSFQPNFLVGLLRELFSQPKKLMAMREKAKSFIKNNNAAEIIAKFLIDYFKDYLKNH